MNNINRMKNLLLSPDPAEGGGEGEALSPAEELTGGDASTTRGGIPGVDTSSAEQPEASQDTHEARDASEASAEEGAEAESGLTKADIEKILANVLPAATQHQQQPAAPAAQITQEQYDQMFNVYKPDVNLVTLLRSEDPNIALKAFIQLRDGLIRQAMTMAEYRMQQYRDHMLNNHVLPLNGYVSEQRAEAFRTDFFKQYPELAPYETIVDAVAAKLEREGTMQGQSRSAIMKRFATDSQTVIKSLLAKGGKSNGAANGGANGTSGRRMSTLTGGGQGGQFKAGGGGKAAGKPSGPSGIEVFD